MKVRVLLFSGLSIGMILIFQNCANPNVGMQFSQQLASNLSSVNSPMVSTGSSSSGGTIISSSSGISSSGSSSSSSSGISSSGSSSGAASSSSGSSSGIASSSSGSGSSGSGSGSSSGAIVESDDDEDKDKKDDDDKDEYVACILQGSGKSIKLGLDNDGHFAEVKSTAESVCITKKACLNLVAPSFKEQGAYERGYCGNNPNTKKLTDVEVQHRLGL